MVTRHLKAGAPDFYPTDHYIAVDGAQSNMAIARMTKESSAIKVVNVPSSVLFGNRDFQLVLPWNSLE